MAGLEEQRRARRWGIFFKAVLFIYLFALLLVYLPEELGQTKLGKGKHTALVAVDGIIAEDGQASADNVVRGLRAAFDDTETAGVILRINSPGGSPVQAGYVNDEIERLRKIHPEIPLYAVITDTCASGGYYIAVAADKIFVNKASIVGSIGVLMDGFGYVGAMQKIGIERRLITAGAHKGFLDPFSPLQAEDVRHVQAMLDDIQSQFVEVVKKGRGDRLKDDQEIFSGLVWTGEQSLELGLADALGGASYVAREVIGAEEIVDFTPKENYFDRFARHLGVVLAEKLSARLQFN
ncbi:MAG: S49 family peptidase [Gammaproteobacteria bacterium]|nr:S49 family peptidase [Gammaproteobacteria bacterium]